MRRSFRIAARLLALILFLALAVGLWKREELTRLLAVNSLFDRDRIVQNFSHMDAAFLTTPLLRGTGPVTPLPQGAPFTLPQGAAAWVEDRQITSLLVLKDGALRHETYHLGTTPEDRRISWSMAKSYLSVLFGILLAEGTIANLDDPVVTYAPSLADSAYAKASLRNVLNMASGVRFDEDYLDKSSDINRMGREIALGGSLDDFTRALNDTVAPPGQVWTYVSIDTHVLGMVIRGATGRSVPDLLQEKVINKLGQEADGYYLTDGTGTAFVLGGLNLTSRDYARFAQMVAQEGEIAGQRVVSADWLTASTTASAPTEAGKMGYGFQWWQAQDPRPGEVIAQGVYGQFLYIDQQRDVVIVMTAADRRFREKGRTRENIEMFRAIADRL